MSELSKTTVRQSIRACAELAARKMPRHIPACGMGEGRPVAERNRAQGELDAYCAGADAAERAAWESRYASYGGNPARLPWNREEAAR